MPDAQRVGARPSRGDRPLPVLVWFHGGSFVIGASSQPVYDGALLAAEQDVVVVSRATTGSARSASSTPAPFGGVANCGLRDAIARARVGARQHRGVRRRSRRASSCSASRRAAAWCCTCSRRPRRAGLFRGAIVQSGATFATLDDERAATRARGVGARRRASPTPTALRDAPGRRARRARRRAAMASLLATVGMMPFHPMVDGDVLPARPVDALARGRGRRRRRSIVGHDRRRDAAVRRPPAAAARRANGSCRRVARYLGVDEPRRRRRSSTTLRARARHRRHERDLGRAVLRQRDAGAVPRACSTRTRRTARRTRTASRGTGPHVGACHGIDIPFTFGNFVDGWDEFVGLDDDGRALSARDARRVGRVRARPATRAGRSTRRRCASAATSTRRRRPAARAARVARRE